MTNYLSIPLFSVKQFEKKFAEHPIMPDKEQIRLASIWIDSLDKNKLDAESKNRSNFNQMILQGILKFSNNLTDPDNYAVYEENEGVDFQIMKNDKTVIIFETKGAKTGLKSKQHGRSKEQETPVSQAWNYMGSVPEAKYGVATNYREFVLFGRSGFTTNYTFDFMDIKKGDEIDLNKLGKFIMIFSQLLRDEGEDTIETLVEESLKEEYKITDEFYGLFYETRIMLIDTFERQNNVDRETAVKWSQKILVRLLFIFFSDNFVKNKEDKIFREAITYPLRVMMLTNTSNHVYNTIKNLFEQYNEGYPANFIPGFDSMLFSEDVPSELSFTDLCEEEFDDKILQKDRQNWLNRAEKNNSIFKLLAKFPKINPIIKNICIMDSYDFTGSELSVNVIGRIFEQSITDLEIISNRNIKLQRKSEGAFYTRKEITDYICRHTILPYISKNESVSVETIIDEYVGSEEISRTTHEKKLKELEDKIKNIKIIDTACGSGAFLVAAIDILVELYMAIHNHKIKHNLGKELDRYLPTHSIKGIIANSIFGIDLNPQAIEMAKLSIFFKIAGEDKLPDLDQLCVGNSLIRRDEVVTTKDDKIDAKDIDDKAFDWNNGTNGASKFSAVLKKGGFDIVIGNPPWDKIKGDDTDFFRPLYQSEKDDNTLIGYKNLKDKDKNKFKKSKLENPDIKKSYSEYEDDKKLIAKYISNSKDYSRISKSGDIDKYQIFTEKSFDILKENGCCGLVLPHGIYSSTGSEELRKLLFGKANVTQIFGFMNNNESPLIFKGVHPQTKFCTLIFNKQCDPDKTWNTNKILCKFDQKLAILSNISDVNNYIDMDSIAKNSGYTVMEISDLNTKNIISKLSEQESLKEQEITLTREFDMTNDSYLFNGAEIPLCRGIPLYQGADMDLFEDRRAGNKSTDKNPLFVNECDGVDRLEYGNLGKTKTPEQRNEELSNRKKKPKKSKMNPEKINAWKRHRLVYRTITNSKNERTLITTILPKNIFLANNLNYVLNNYSNDRLLYLCGIFNSFPADFFLRTRVDKNMNKHILERLPIPRYKKNNFFCKKIVENTAKLICARSDDFTDLENSAQITHGAREESRLLLEAQITANAGMLYGLDENQMNVICESFVPRDAGGERGVPMDELKKKIMCEFAELFKHKCQDDVEAVRTNP